MKTSIRDSQAAQIVTDHVASERAAGRKVSCKSLLNHLGYTTEEANNSMNAVRAFIKSGEFPGLKLVQKEGIVPADYRLGKEVKQEETDKKKADREAKKLAESTAKAKRKAERLQKKAEKDAEKKVKAAAKEAQKVTEAPAEATSEATATVATV